MGGRGGGGGGGFLFNPANSMKLQGFMRGGKKVTAFAVENAMVDVFLGIELSLQDLQACAFAFSRVILH